MFAVIAVLVTGVAHSPTAEAARPGDNGRTAYLKQGNVMIFDGTFNHPLTDNGKWQDRVTWCGTTAVVAEEIGVGIVEIPVDRDSNAGTPFVIYSDPGNSLRDPACNGEGTEVAAVMQRTVVTVPTEGDAGLTPVAVTASGASAFEPAWSSDDRSIAFEDAISSTVSVIEVASAKGKFISGGTAVTPASPGLRRGPSWRENKIYYWKQATSPRSLGIFSVTLGDTNEFGPYGGTGGDLACRDPAALPDGTGFECVGSDTLIKVFPGPTTLNDTDASKPDVERISWSHHEHHNSEHGHNHPHDHKR